MSQLLHSYGVWLADYYLLASILLVGALAATFLVKQPAWRLAIVKSAATALLGLAMLCAAPRFSLVHLSARSNNIPSAADIHASLATPSAAVANEEVDHSADTQIRERATRATTPVISTSWKNTFENLSWIDVVVATHALGTTVAAAWLLLGLLASRRLLKSAQPAPPELIHALAQLPDHRMSTIGLRVMTHEHIQVAAAVGVSHPAILLPSAWLDSQSPSQVLTALAHEVRHVENRDLAWIGISRLLMLALWANPLLWLMRKQLRLDQELLADAAAADLIGRPMYAELLVDWAHSLGGRPMTRIAASVGLWESPSQLRQRVALLLNEHFTILRSCPRSWKVTSAATLIAAALALSIVTLQPQAAATAEPAPTSSGKDAKLGISQQSATANSAANTPKPNTVTGLALKENHEPVAAAEVFLFRYDHSDSSRKLIGQTKTSNDGRFDFDNVIDIEKEFPNGKFPARDQVGNEFIQCIVRTSGLVPFEWMATPTQVAEQGMFQAAVMPTGATLAGRVTGPDGVPVASALVTVGRGFGNWEGINSARTDANGNYQIADLKPFDLAAYQKQAEEAQRSGGNVFMAFPESLTIEAPNFATKQLQFAKIPGQQDVQLVRPAVLEGRAIYAGSNEAAPNIMVQASTMISAENFRKIQSRQEFPVKTAVRTDQAGKYRFAALPPGSYSISAEVPDWVTIGITATDATSEKATQLSDLIFTKGGFISARLVDATTKQPIPLESGMHLMLIASSTSSPPVGGPTVKTDLEANSRGRFEMRAPAGKKSVAIGSLNRHDGATTWFGRLPVESNVVEGQSVEIDVPVEKYNAGDAAGKLSVAIVEPKEEKTIGEKSEPSSDGKPAAERQQKPDEPKSSKRSEDTKPKPKGSESPQLSVVIAKHALLLGGNEITTWEELTAKIAALPDPSKAQLHFYSTNGALEAGDQQALHNKIYALSKKFKLQGHSEGSLLPRAGARYDHIVKQSDLTPDPSLRVTGTVFDTKNQPVAGADVVLIAPVDESLPYKDFDIAMVQGRIRNPLDEIYTVSDATGHFEIYPPKGAKYRLLVAHPDFGFNLADDDSTTKVVLIPWAKLTCKLGAEDKSKPSADLRTRPQNRPGYPDISINQYWEDLKLSEPTDTFSFNDVPAILETTIGRSFSEHDGGSVSIADSSVSLLPGEDRRIELGPLNDKQREWLQFNRDQFNKLHAPPKTEAETASKQGADAAPPRSIPAVFAAEEKPDDKKPPTILSYGDGKPDGKKSYGGIGEMIRFELPEGVTKIKGIRIHASRYGLPQAPDENFEITFLSDKRDEVLHTETPPYKLFKRGKEVWVRIPFEKEVELPKKFWIALNFNAEQTKGVYVSYDTSTKGQYSRVGLAGDDKEPKETEFGGDWMVQVFLAPPGK